MRKLIYSCSFLLFSVIVARSEEIKITERPITAKYSDGTIEKYVVVYTGNMNVNWSESGGPAKPFEGKFIDDRRCQWSIDSFIKRTVYQQNRVGKRSIYDPATALYPTSFKNQGTSFSFLDLRPGNCNDTVDRRNSDIQNARNAVNNEFQSTVDRDFTSVQPWLKNELSAIEIAIQ